MQASIVATLWTAASIAARTKEWVIVVVPDGSDFISAFGACAAGALPSGTSLGGRTALLPGGGRLSITPVGQDPFVPTGTLYSVMFAGWGDDIAADNRRMLLWRQGATQVHR
jgi:hypothetical protein